MTRKQRARVVINLIRELALKHGDKNPRVEEDGSRTQIIHFHYDWSAVLSIGPTNPPVPPALFVEEPRKSKKISEGTLPHWVRVSIFGIRVFVCEFDDEDVYIVKFHRQPWDSYLLRAVELPPDFGPHCPASNAGTVNQY
jgi:hypothetical protein